jgi:beta-lactamase class A
MIIDRRRFVAASLAASAFAASAAQPSDLFADLRQRLGTGGRLGVAALDSGSGRRLQSDAQSRFAMASTFKLALAGATLSEADSGRLSLDDPITFTKSDLVNYAPVVEAALPAGHLTIAQLSVAIITVSDNAAANLLLKQIGGPPGLTRFFRSCGDRISRLDRWETALNSNESGDPRDTSSANAMLQTMNALLVGRRLKPASRTQLLQWLSNSKTGLNRLRAGFPKPWLVGDKTGTGARGAYNDLAIAWPQGRPPILVAAFLDGGAASEAERAEIHQEIARRLTLHFR